MWHPNGRPGFRPHIRLLKVSPHPGGCIATTPLLPVAEKVTEAGLTSKPHRDRATKSRLTWTASPAAGIGLLPRGTGDRNHRGGATTDPSGCHTPNVSGRRQVCSAHGQTHISGYSESSPERQHHARSGPGESVRCTPHEGWPPW